MVVTWSNLEVLKMSLAAGVFKEATMPSEREVQYNNLTLKD